jgi:hypothetical protein
LRSHICAKNRKTGGFSVDEFAQEKAPNVLGPFLFETYVGNEKRPWFSYSKPGDCAVI